MPAASTKQKLLWISAFALLVAVVLGAAGAIWFLLRHRASIPAVNQDAPAATASISDSSPFPGVRESDIPGRYRWFHGGIDGGVIQLRADHTFVNKDGKTLPKYRWELTQDGLRIIWQSGQISRFPVMERPGVFVFLRPNGEDSRLEKIEGNTK